ncbi:MAG: hypothetical protein U9N80_09605 [Chloroflexota bacterium]|nr:hypothetical protein [Chloroflexota bacterium]
MQNKTSSSLTDFDDLFPEDVSRPAEKRDYWVWIYIPLLIVILVFVGIGFLVVRAGFGSASVWADTSLIFMLLPMILLGLVLAILFGFMIFGVVRLIIMIPEWFISIRRFFWQAENAVQRTGDIAVRPFTVMKSSWAALRESISWLGSIARIFKGETHD